MTDRHPNMTCFLEACDCEFERIAKLQEIAMSNPWYNQWQIADRRREQAEKVLITLCAYLGITIEFPLNDGDVEYFISTLTSELSDDE